MHRNIIFYALICINNHVLSCLISILSMAKSVMRQKRAQIEVELKKFKEVPRKEGLTRVRRCHNCSQINPLIGRQVLEDKIKGIK